MTSSFIDSHQHFWQLARQDYDWLTPDLTSIYRDFMPNDFTPLLKENGISGSILIQAAPTLAETNFLLQLAKRHHFIKAVIGWVDMENPQTPETIAILQKNPTFRGIRPMLQDIADDKWMLKTNLTPTFQTLVEFNLCFDALIYPKHLPYLFSLCKRYPTLTVVIDHAAKPNIKAREFTNWANHIESLAKHTNVYCKLSGLFTEAKKEATAEQLLPYINHLFACFGAKRILWGSDWPVLTLASDYQTWFNFCYQYAVKNFTNKINDIFGNNARRCYRLSIPS